METENKYYANIPCRVLADVGESEVVILLDSWSEDETRMKLVVNRKYLTDAPVDKEGVVKKITFALAQADREIAEKRLAANRDLYAERQKIESELKELRKKAEKFQGLTDFYDYLNGDIRYVVYADHYSRCGIAELDKVWSSGDENKYLASVSFRQTYSGTRDGTIEMYVGTYSDNSGSQWKVKGFKNIDDAVKYFIDEHIEKRAINSEVVVACNRYNITHPKVEQFKKEQAQKQEESKQKRIAELNAAIEKLKTNQ